MLKLSNTKTITGRENIVADNDTLTQPEINRIIMPNGLMLRILSEKSLKNAVNTLYTLF